VSVLLGNGDGTFQVASSFAVGDSPGAVTAADLNGDTIPDLVTANGRSDDVSVLLGNGDGSFKAATAFVAGDGPVSVAVADLDGDTIPDLVIGNLHSDDVSVLLGDGGGSFQAALSFAAGDRPRSVAVADLDGDGIPDLVTANENSDDLSVLLGNGDGTFQSATAFLAGDSPSSVAVADLDGDTHIDLVTANPLSRDVSVLLNLGEGFAIAVEIDIKPGGDSELNPINPLSRGIIPVAILGSAQFGIAGIDVTTLVFGPGGSAAVHRRGGHLDDVNDDGFMDLVSHFRTEGTGIAFGDTEACVAGEMLDGTLFEGCDAIQTVLACGVGFELVFLLPPVIWAHGRRRRSAHRVEA